MIYQTLSEQLTESATELLQEALLHPSVLDTKRLSLVPLYGVTPQEICDIRVLLDIKALEFQLSPQCPFYTIMPADQFYSSLNSHWIAVRGGSRVLALAMQELSAGRIKQNDETLLIQIIEKLPSEFLLIIRNL